MSLRASSPGQLLLPLRGNSPSAHTGVAIRSLEKCRKTKAFQGCGWPLKGLASRRHTSDIGHSLQVLGDEGALELVRAFGRFAMTKTDFVDSLRPAQNEPGALFRFGRRRSLSRPASGPGGRVCGEPHSTVTRPFSPTVTVMPSWTKAKNSSPRLSTTGILASVQTSARIAPEAARESMGLEKSMQAGCLP